MINFSSGKTSFILALFLSVSYGTAIFLKTPQIADIPFFLGGILGVSGALIAKSGIAAFLVWIISRKRVPFLLAFSLALFTFLINHWLAELFIVLFS